MVNPAVSHPLCAFRRGVFLLTPCANAAVARCSGCGAPVCSEHARGQGSALLCPNCRRSRADDDHFDHSSRSYSSSQDTGSSTVSDDFAGQGGEFGGGGATSDWSDAPAEEGGAGSDDKGLLFSEEDYAAFDSVSDFDKNADVGSGFDS
jgi:hypothetical protein